jgi:hypothetical protein
LILHHFFSVTAENGLGVQIHAELITYLLLAIYCQEHFGEKVSIKRGRQLHMKIKNEALIADNLVF